MQYKTIVLELLEQHPEIHEQLRKERKLLPTMERLASELKTSHEAWKAQLLQATPGSDPSQIASEALEMAVEELEQSLPAASLADGSEALSLDGAMAYLQSHMPKG